jgi:TRAP-type C4-dicarboxylate transport system permease large subunit
MYLIAVSTVLGDIVVQERAAENLALVMGQISSNPIFVLLLINLFLIVVGMAIDNLPALIICSTMLLPVIKSTGIDPVHFGVVICFNLIVGIITPPMGIGLYIASRVSEISVERVIKAVLPFLAPLLVSLLLISVLPGLSLWLPNLVFGPAR